MLVSSFETVPAEKREEFELHFQRLGHGGGHRLPQELPLSRGICT
ncbi:hypothetical protein PVAG01_06548 [Phlyctema vagabunda]|uniref:Uncharacterized protein n=1 Tax=Phlyctema vagabunda TaxID=108571 RepID=A0ABR4PH12_9HELO